MIRKKIKLSFDVTSSNLSAKEGIPYEIKVRHAQRFNSNLTIREVFWEVQKQYDLINNKNSNINEDFSVYWANADICLWAKYFNLENFENEYEFYDYLDYKIGDLEEQFSLSDSLIEIYINPCIGGDVGRCRGIHFFFHTDEKDIHRYTPHIHVKSADEEYRVNLSTLEIMDKPFKNPRKNKLVLRVLKDNQDDLNKYWNKVVIKGESLKYKMYIRY